MSGEDLRWPNGKRVAVAVTVMYETWSPGKAPSYSVQATALKPGTEDHAGKAWSTYGGRVGVWRILRTLDRWGIPATFFTNARCAELYPESVVQIVKSGHELGGHAIYQDQLLSYMDVDEQRETIRRSLDMLEEHSGERPDRVAQPGSRLHPRNRRAARRSRPGLARRRHVHRPPPPRGDRTRRHRRRAEQRLHRQSCAQVEPPRPRGRAHPHVRLPAGARADEFAHAHPALPVRRTADGDERVRRRHQAHLAVPRRLVRSAQRACPLGTRRRASTSTPTPTGTSPDDRPVAHRLAPGAPSACRWTTPAAHDWAGIGADVVEPAWEAASTQGGIGVGSLRSPRRAQYSNVTIARSSTTGRKRSATRASCWALPR